MSSHDFTIELYLLVRLEGTIFHLWILLEGTIFYGCIVLQDPDEPEMSDWERYAAEEYEILVAEEGANELNGDDMWVRAQRVSSPLNDLNSWMEMNGTEFDKTRWSCVWNSGQNC